MHRNSAVSMYAGDGGTRRRPSVSTMGGLRNLLRNETDTDCAPATVRAPISQDASPSQAASVGANDDKETLRGLNTRLNGYLDKVKQLRADNSNLEKQIDDILAKRQAPVGRDWDETQNNLNNLRQKIKDITMNNAKLMVESDNALMANADLKTRLDTEKKLQKTLEHDLESLKKVMDENKVKLDTLKDHIKSVKYDIDDLQKEHKDEVNNLCEKIKTSEVNVEMESENNTLSSSVDSIRREYDKFAEKNLKDTEDWYKKKFENIKVVEAQNTEALESGKAEQKAKLKEKQILEMRIQTLLSTIKHLEEVLQNTKMQCGERLGAINNELLSREKEVIRVRTQVEHQAGVNKKLVSVKMKLEEEIQKYHDLMNKVTTGDSLEFSLADKSN